MNFIEVTLICERQFWMAVSVSSLPGNIDKQTLLFQTSEVKLVTNMMNFEGKLQCKLLY